MDKQNRNNKGENLLIITNKTYTPKSNIVGNSKKVAETISVLFNNKKSFKKISFLAETSTNILEKTNKLKEPFTVMFLPDVSEVNIHLFKEMIFKNKKCTLYS